MSEHESLTAQLAAANQRADAAERREAALAQRVRYVERMNYVSQRQIRGMDERWQAVQPGDTVRLVCLTTGAFRGLVRAVDVSEGLCTVTAETPILDWLTTGERGEYPYQTWEVGHRFNPERNELRAIAATSAAEPSAGQPPQTEGV